MLDEWQKSGTYTSDQAIATESLVLENHSASCSWHSAYGFALLLGSTNSLYDYTLVPEMLH